MQFSYDIADANPVVQKVLGTALVILDALKPRMTNPEVKNTIAIARANIAILQANHVSLDEAISSMAHAEYTALIDRLNNEEGQPSVEEITEALKRISM